MSGYQKMVYRIVVVSILLALGMICRADERANLVQNPSFQPHLAAGAAAAPGIYNPRKRPLSMIRADPHRAVAGWGVAFDSRATANSTWEPPWFRNANRH